MKKLKLFFTMLMLIAFSVGNVWADTEATLSISSKPSSSSETLTDDQSNEWAFTSDGTVSGSETNLIHVGTNSSQVSYIQLVSTGLSSNNISEIHVWAAAKASTNVTIKIYIGENLLGTSSVLGNTSSSGGTEFSVNNTDNYSGEVKILVSRPSKANGAIYFNSATVTYTTGGGGSDPSLSASPATIDFGTVYKDASVEDKAVAVTFANLTGSVSYSGLTSPFSASGSISASGDEIAISADASTIGEYEQTLTVQSAGDALSKTVTVTMKVVAAPEPTGTFELFSGDIEEGDYLIVVDGAGMNTTVSSSRLQYTALTLTGENYVNPDASVIWHVEASDVYWTIYNAEEEKYAAATGSNNQAQMLASGTDDKSLWTITHSGSVYTIQNKSNSRYLKKNGTYGFACYADGTVSLYKKVEGGVKPAAGLEYAAADQKKLAKLGDAFTAPTLINPNNLTVTYASNATAVAEVAANGAVTINGAGVAVITASFAGNDDYKEGSASYTIGVTTHAGTEADPYSVADAINVIDGIGTKADAYVSGKISQVDSYSDQYKSITYWISDDGTTTNQLQVYSGKGIGGADFSSVDDVAVKATVIVTGTLKKHNSTYEFDYNNELVSYAAPVEPVVTLKQSGSAVTELNLDATGVANQAIDIVCANFESAISSVSAKLYGESTCETEITSGAWVTDITVNNEKTQLTFNVADNDGAARQVWMKVTAGDGSSEASAVLAISQAKYNAPAELPFAFDEGRADIENTQGMSQEGLDTDYGSSPKLKFNSTGDYVIINIADAPAKLTYDIKNNSFSGGTFDVQESADGVTYTSVANYTEITGTQNEEHNLKQETRYVKFVYTNKSSGNVALGNITIVAPAAVEAPTFSLQEGAYTGTQSVELSCTTDGATIYYTTNGDDPDDSSTEYTAAISVDETMTIKAIAYKGNDHSEIASAAYTITPALTDYYQKVTSTDNIVDGTYLIVYEEGDLAFDGGLETLDAVGNTIPVTIVGGNKIGVTNTTEAATFFIDVTAGTIKSASNKYIGVSSNSNGLKQAEDASTYLNTFAIDDDGNAVITASFEGSAMSLRYNKGSNQTRFRYFQNAGQQPIALYKLANEVVKQDPGISWDRESAEVTLYDYLTPADYPEPGLIIQADLGDNPLDFITLSSDNESLATINKTNDGQIKISWVPDVTGTVHFTAAFPGNDTYKAVTAKCTVTIKPEAQPAVTKNVVILAEYNSKFYAMTTTLESKAFKAVEVEKEADKIYVFAEADKAAIQWTMTDNTTTATFQDADDKYLAHTGTGTDLTLQADAEDWTWDSENGYYYAVANRTFFYSNSGVFKNYSTSNLPADKTDYSGAPEIIEIAAENIILSSKVDPALAYTPTSDEITAGDAWSAPVLGYIEGFDGLAAITYESSNEAVATVTDAGVIALAGGTGTATITASFPGNTNYLSGSATYTITVNEAGDDLSGTWTRVTAVAAGQKIIIAGTYNSKTMAVGKQNSNNRAAVLGALDGDVLTPGATTNVFTLVDAGEGLFAIQASNGKYLNAAGTGNSNYLREADDYEAASAKWTITFDENGANIVATSTGNRNVIRYNSTNNSELFSCYAAGTQRAINIYSTTAVPPTPVYETVRDGLEVGRHYTVCLAKNVTAVKGATFWSLKNKKADDTEVYLEEENAPFDAGKPFIFQATAAKLEVVYGNESANEGKTNGALVGTLEDLDADAFAAISGNIYLLISNALRPRTSGNFLNANRAYVNYDALTPGQPQSAPGKQVRSMPMQPKVATGVENGELLNGANGVQKVLINGELFILQGEKMYNASGVRVK